MFVHQFSNEFESFLVFESVLLCFKNANVRYKTFQTRFSANLYKNQWFWGWGVVDVKLSYSSEC